MRVAEFTVDVPLADIDDDSQSADGPDFSSDLRGVVAIIESIDEANYNNNNYIAPRQHPQNQSAHGNLSRKTKKPENSSSPDTETFSETLAGSLEDLVGCFDEKISHCFKDLKEDTENIAPVQMRTQEEIMNESQIWWTLTGNFGNILPIDWSKSYARKLQLPALRLRPKNLQEDIEESSSNDLDVSDDEDLVQALDLHSLIASQLSPAEPPPQTADEVIEEIDEIFMQQSYTSEWTACSDLTTDSGGSFSHSSAKSSFGLATSVVAENGSFLEDHVQEVARMASCEGDLCNMTYKELVVLHSELETLFKIYNETLVQELALRDELEYEKEVKNKFVSLLLSVQNKRRQWNVERKRKVSDGKTTPTTFMNGMSLPQYLTAIIPYDEEMGPVDNATLERLIEILQAVNDDNPKVPGMLTDYILTVVCPSTNTSLSLAW